MIAFGVLGRLTIHRNGEPVTLALMPRRLLAILLSRAGTEIPADELVTGLWEGMPPATARKTLQVYMHRLRQSINMPGCIESGSGGYSVRVATGELDALRFAHLVEKGREARRRSDNDLASAMFARALAQWRGEPYADIGIGAVADEVSRLLELRLQVRTESLMICLDREASDNSIGELGQLSTEHPYRDELLAYLMLALYRRGRQVEALELFRARRTLLIDRLGIEPGELLRWLHTAILRSDSRLWTVPLGDLHRLASSAPQDTRAAEAAEWTEAGLAQSNIGHHGEAVVCHQRAVDLYVALGDQSGESKALVGVGDAHYAGGDIPAAAAAWQRALSLVDSAEIRQRLALIKFSCDNRN